jgi:hypothetical protein
MTTFRDLDYLSLLDVPEDLGELAWYLDNGVPTYCVPLDSRRLIDGVPHRHVMDARSHTASFVAESRLHPADAKGSA